MKWSNSLDMIILNYLCMQSCDVFRLEQLAQGLNNRGRPMRSCQHSNPE